MSLKSLSHKSLAALTVPAALAFASPAMAQYMPHLDPNLYILTTMQMNNGANTCMTGASPPDGEIAEARDPAPAVMQAYFDAAVSGGARSPMFRESKKTTWSHGGVTVPFEQIDRQSDPLAAAGNRLDRDPLRFFRAGNFQTAHGQWSVLDGAGSIVGVYDAQFRRKDGDWLLDKLTVIGADESVAPAMQYCLEPGDVTPHKIESAGNRIEYLEKQITKSEAKLVKDEAKLAKAESKLAEKPGSANYTEAVSRAKASVESRKEKLTNLREGLGDARESLANSNRDAAEILAMTGPARDVLRIRDFETTTAKEEAEEKAKKEAEEAESKAG